MLSLMFLLSFVVSFSFMEVVAWIMHRYVMHGLLWVLHQDHHDPKHSSSYQKNDLFFLMFSVPGALIIYFGLRVGPGSPLFACGIGVSTYGVAYFLVHECIIHRRFKFVPQFRHPYFAALRRAHGTHHRHRGKLDGECFGMLAVPLKYYREAWERRPRE